MPLVAQAVGYPHRMRRIERLINLIAALLETSRPLPAQEIRERIAGYGDEPSFEAFRRAFERDKESLRAMGIPLDVVSIDPLSDDPDGYIIPKSKYYLPELDLDPDELAALRIAGEGLIGSGGEEAEAGLMKLSVGATAATWGGPRVVYGADVAAEQPLLAPLMQAVLDRAPLSFRYASGTGAMSDRTMEPYGLVHRKGSWYIVGKDRGREAIRAFKVSRIEDPLEKLPGRFERPAGFNAAEQLKGEAWEIGGGDRTIAVVEIAADLNWWARQNIPGVSFTDLEGGAVRVELPVANQGALISWVLGLGDKAKIVSPQEARSALIQHLMPVANRS